MRIIKEKALSDYYAQSEYKKAEEPLKAWVYELRNSIWANSSELKLKYRHASILSSKRVVFNIKGNDYRLIVDIEYNPN